MAESVLPATGGPSFEPSWGKGLGAWREVTNMEGGERWRHGTRALKGRHVAPQGQRLASDLVWRVLGSGVFRQKKCTGSGSEGEESLPHRTEGSPEAG